jgi:sarcosine oxidase
MIRREYDCIVLGLGGFGSAALYWLARRHGVSVLGLEQFELDHVRGSSEDHSRIIRLSYHTPSYVELAKAAFSTWDEVAIEAGEPLVLETGGLNLQPAGSKVEIEPYASSMRKAGVEFESLDGREIRRRWPAFHIDDATIGLHHAKAGIAMASRANRAHRRLGAEYGARIEANQPVRHIRLVSGEVDVVTDKTTYRCGRLVLTAGAWTPTALAWLGIALPLEVTQEQVNYFRPSKPGVFDPARFPIWIWHDEPTFYGFPVFGEPAVKVSEDAGGPVVTADTRSFVPDVDVQARVLTFLRKYIPDAAGGIHLSKTCLYTLTPDRDFLLDYVPGHPEISVVLGCGHGFKFASLFGRTLAELSLGEAPSIDLQPFAFDRPALRDPDASPRYRV